MSAPLIELVECTPLEEDARRVMAWRNDPMTRAMSFHQEAKVWESFWPEFRTEYFAHTGLPPLWGFHQDGPAVFLRVEPADDPTSGRARTCLVSIMVDPEQRGRGLGRAGLDALHRWLLARGWQQVAAEVRRENRASVTCFEKSGYLLLEETEKQVADTGESAGIRRYLLRLRRSPQGGEGVYVIAEAGSNWRMGSPQRDLAMGRTLIELAAEAGADAVKFQTYRPETLYVKNAGASDYLSSAGITQDIGQVLADLVMPYQMVPELALHCERCGVDFMSSPFSEADFAAVDPHVRVHKIASYEISHTHLLESAARSGKPLVLSTGASTMADIGWAVDTFRAAGGRDLVLMQCTAKYPAPPDSLNLRAIPRLAETFGVPAGLSDHSRDPLHAPLAAVALGARVIEKHFTLHNRLAGPDHAFAVNPEELKKMVTAIREVELMLGSGEKRVLAAEQELAGYARRGVQAIQDIAPGEPLREGVNIDILRPGRQRQGLHPKHLPEMEGKPAARRIPMGEGIGPGDWDD